GQPGRKSWVYKDGNLYSHIHFMKSSLNFIVKINLIPIFLKITLLFLVVIFFVIFIARFFIKYVKKAIINISLPIEYIVEEVNKIAGGDLSHNISIKSGIYEVDKLSESIESMRNELIDLIKKEKENEHIKTEIQLASRIQSAFLSQSSKELDEISECLDIFSCYDKGNMISGDIYFINRVGESIYIFVGDLSGKDVAASIFSLFVLARFKILSRQLLNPAQLLIELNNYLCEFNSETMFITATCCKIDTNSMTCIFANAGHDRPLLYSAETQKAKEILCDSNLVLGVLAEQSYTETQLQLCKNEEVILYTDGITEAAQNNKQYGKSRLINFVQDCDREAATDLAAALVADVAKFNYDDKNKDDRTVVWVRSKKDNFDII
ncbi:PP2C family protein-serine/threonine phosphatase, partial [Piscirickettsia litoralis]|uniref:PP2C family protein-serine/threonine phosphatase n=1 Tax=Piscirickettsia litoralis TaxID=1891921 RepID=UPI0013010BE8